ncbi:MAG: hypothetical protein ACK5WZ_07315, partial [Pseudobdellovibrionaceae bacterium]
MKDLIKSELSPMSTNSDTTAPSAWTPANSAEIYSINNWGNGYYRVNGQGHVCVTPCADPNQSLDLYELTQD